MMRPAHNGNGNGSASRWQLIVSIAGIVFLVCGALYAYIGTTTATNLQVTTNATEVRNLTTQYNLIVDRLQAIRNDQTKQSEALKEIETQFCSSDHIRNLMHAADQRIMGMLWQKVYGQVYPTNNTYYPTTCNRLRE